MRIPSVRKHRLGCLGNHRRASVSARSTLLVASYATRTTICDARNKRVLKIDKLGEYAFRSKRQKIKNRTR